MSIGKVEGELDALFSAVSALLSTLTPDQRLAFLSLFDTGSGYTRDSMMDKPYPEQYFEGFDSMRDAIRNVVLPRSAA